MPPQTALSESSSSTDAALTLTDEDILNDPRPILKPIADPVSNPEGLKVLRPRKIDSKCTLYILPAEVRDNIFHRTLPWAGKTPPMLIALRQEPMLYHEALGVFRKENIFEISGEDPPKKMSHSSGRTLERLSLRNLLVLSHVPRYQRQIADRTQRLSHCSELPALLPYHVLRP
jgi:hypothetical protein